MDKICETNVYVFCKKTGSGLEQAGRGQTEENLSSVGIVAVSGLASVLPDLGKYLLVHYISHEYIHEFFGNTHYEVSSEYLYHFNHDYFKIYFF